MKSNFALAGISFGCGILFAVALAISGMTQPAKVIGFLNFFHGWDPALAFVMVGAIGTHLLLVKVIFRSRSQPFLAENYSLPQKSKVDMRLVVGALIFGAGWGLAGLCPGPALANFVGWGQYALAAISAMIVGMYTTRLIDVLIGNRKIN